MKTTIQQPPISFHQSRVCDLLRWHPDTLSQYIFNKGIEYLTDYFINDDEAVSKISKQPSFWGWWKNEWNMRDAAYLDVVDGREDELSVLTMNKIYRSLHLTSILICEIAPPRIVYPADFTTIKIEMA